MWNRAELKTWGKTAFLANYWRCVLVALVLAVLIGGGTAAGGKHANNSAGDGSTLIQELQRAPRVAFAMLTGAIAGLAAAGGIVKLLVINPLLVGCKRFFLVNSDQPAELGELGYGFRNGYGGVVVTMLLRDLFIALWSLLFIIPGIVKAYSYRMVPYILAENPGISGLEAIERSKQMMRGHKWNAFMLDLSFVGWYLLAAVTAHIIGVLWTAPYVEATGAELYKSIR